MGIKRKRLDECSLSAQLAGQCFWCGKQFTYNAQSVFYVEGIHRATKYCSAECAEASEHECPVCCGLGWLKEDGPALPGCYKCGGSGHLGA